MLHNETEQAAEKHLMGRLLGFSDIVMAFSLAFLGLSLHLPAAVTEITKEAPDIGAFLVGFALIALVWWFHNKLFAHYFVPNLISIVLNFAMLAGVVLLVYALEVCTLLFHSANPDVTAYKLGFSLWVAAYGIVMTLLGAMYALGLRERWSSLSDALRRWGLERAANAGVGGLVLLLMAIMAPYVPFNFFGLLAIFAFIPVAAQKLALLRLRSDP